MFSAGLIALVWWTFTTIMARNKRIPQGLLLPIGFVTALSSLFIVYFFSVEFLSISQFIAVVIVSVCVMLSILLSRSMAALQAWRLMAQYLALVEWKPPTGEAMAPASQWRLSRIMAGSRKLMTIAVIAILVSAALLQAFPTNWDSNVYNLGRLPAMILSGSPLLPMTGSIRQAAMPLGHDLIYFPDIAFNNLRGLSLVNCLEYIALVGGLIQLAEICVDEMPLLQINRPIARELSLLITCCLLFSSDQQTLQALSTKNDLIIVVLFVLAMLISLHHNMAPATMGHPNFLSISILIAAYAITCKSYGVVVVIPPLICVAAANLQGLKGVHSGLLNTSRYSRVFRGWIVQFFRGLTVPSCAMLMMATVILATFFLHQWFVLKHYQGPGLDAVTTYWTNTQGPISQRLANMGLNLIRIVVSFFAYPYSTWLKSPPLSQDDYLLGLGPFGPWLNQGGNGLPERLSFVLARKREEDYALSSPLFHIILFIVLASMAIHFLHKLRLRDARPFRRLSEPFHLNASQLIVLSSAASLCLIFAAILYQNWIFRFVGIGYVPLMPVLATAFTGLLIPSAGEGEYKKKKFSLILAIGLLACLVTLYIFMANVSTSSKSLLISLGNWRSQPLGEISKQSPRAFYYQYLYGHKVTNTEVDQFLESIQDNSFQKQIICYREDTPSLTPLLAVVNQPKDRTRVELRSASDDQCRPKKGEWQAGSARYLWQRQISLDNREQLILLP